MQVTRENLNACTIQLEIVCDESQVQDGFARAYKTIAKEVRVPGFRPGSAPRTVIDQHVPREKIVNAAADEIVRSSLTKALKQESIEPNDYPAVTLRRFDPDTFAFEYQAKVPLKPIVELGEYKGLKAQRPKVDVTDADVERHLESLRNRAGERAKVVDRGVQQGDIAVVNIKVDGEEGEGRNFMSVVGDTFPGLDEAITGMFVEEMKVVSLSFPDTFQERDWAGKTLGAKVTIRSLNALKVPELDDDFAQKFATENVDDLRVKVREWLVQAENQMAQDFVDEQLQVELLKNSKIEVPDTMWEQVAQRRLQELQRDVQARGITIEEYAKRSGMEGLDALVEEWKREAKTHVMRAVAIRDIFMREKLRVDNRDLNDALQEMAAEYEMPPAELFDAIKKQKAFDELNHRAIFKKVIKFLNANAKIEEVAVGTTS